MELPALAIQQPDFARTLSSVAQIKGASLQNKLIEAQLARQQKTDALAGNALDDSGQVNQSAITEWMRMDPKGASGFLDAINKMDATKIEQERRRSEPMVKGLMYVLNQPPEAQPMAYAQLIGQLKASGHQFQQEPPPWNAQRAEMEVLKGLSVAEYDNRLKEQNKAPEGFKRTDSGLVPIPGGPADPSYKGRVAAATREPDQKYSGEVFMDKRVGKYYQINPKTNKREYISPNEEFIVESDGQGGFRISKGAGGEGGMTKKTQGAIEDKLVAAKEGLVRLKGVADKYREEYQQIPTRMGAAWTGLKAKLGADIDPADKTLLEDFSAYKQESIANLNIYINDMTGAAMGEAEAKRLRKAVPDAGDGMFDGDDPISFKSKMDNAISQLEKAQVRYEYYLKQGITNAYEMAEKTPLDKIQIAVNPKTGERIANINGEWVPVK